MTGWRQYGLSSNGWIVTKMFTAILASAAILPAAGGAACGSPAAPSGEHGRRPPPTELRRFEVTDVWRQPYVDGDFLRFQWKAFDAGNFEVRVRFHVEGGVQISDARFGAAEAGAVGQTFGSTPRPWETVDVEAVSGTCVQGCGTFTRGDVRVGGGTPPPPA